MPPLATLAAVQFLSGWDLHRKASSDRRNGSMTTMWIWSFMACLQANGNNFAAIFRPDFSNRYTVTVDLFVTVAMLQFTCYIFTRSGATTCTNLNTYFVI